MVRRCDYLSHPEAFQIRNEAVTSRKKSSAMASLMVRHSWRVTRRSVKMVQYIILHITYGYTVAYKNDSYVSLTDAAVHSLSRAGIFGTYLVDYIPILKHVPSWMPGASFKRQARVWHCLAREVLESQFNIVKENMVSWSPRYIHWCWQDLQAKGTAVSCIASHELETWIESDKRTGEEEVIKNITVIAYTGQLLFIGDIKTALIVIFTASADTVSDINMSVISTHNHTFDRLFQQ